MKYIIKISDKKGEEDYYNSLIFTFKDLCEAVNFIETIQIISNYTVEISKDE